MEHTDNYKYSDLAVTHRFDVSGLNPSLNDESILSLDLLAIQLNRSPISVDAWKEIVAKYDISDQQMEQAVEHFMDELNSIVLARILLKRQVRS